MSVTPIESPIPNPVTRSPGGLDGRFSMDRVSDSAQNRLMNTVFTTAEGAWLFRQLVTKCGFRSPALVLREAMDAYAQGKRPAAMKKAKRVSHDDDQVRQVLHTARMLSAQRGANLVATRVWLTHEDVVACLAIAVDLAGQSPFKG